MSFFLVNWMDWETIGVVWEDVDGEDEPRVRRFESREEALAWAKENLNGYVEAVEYR